MKKLSTALILCLSVFFAFVVTACEGEHTHSYSSNWTYDADNHWHVCETTDCDEVSDKAAHTIENGACSVCGTIHPSVITAKEFATALSPAAFNNVSMSMSSKTPKYDDGGSGIIGVEDETITMLITETAQKWVIDSETMYYEFVGSTIYGYATTTIGSESITVRIKATEDYEGALDKLYAAFTQISFSELTYENESYTGTITITEEGESASLPLTLKFENKRLTYLSLDMRSIYGLEDELISSFSFSDYGTTTVTLPTVFIDGDAFTGGGAEGSLASSFALENVTIGVSATASAIDEGSESVVNYSYTLKYANDSIGYSGDVLADGEIISSNAAYYDGTNWSYEYNSAATDDQKTAIADSITYACESNPSIIAGFAYMQTYFSAIKSV